LRNSALDAKPYSISAEIPAVLRAEPPACSAVAPHSQTLTDDKTFFFVAISARAAAILRRH
jgi:hypothetical protein